MLDIQNHMACVAAHSTFLSFHGSSRVFTLCLSVLLILKRVGDVVLGFPVQGVTSFPCTHSEEQCNQNVSRFLQHRHTIQQVNAGQPSPHITEDEVQEIRAGKLK